MIRTLSVASLGCIVALLCGGIRIDPAVEVLEVVLAAGVAEREPSRPFSPPGPCRAWGKAQTPRIDPVRHPSIVLWTRIKSAAPLDLVHTYYRAASSEGQEVVWQEVTAVTLPIGRSPGWRTWSQKRLAGDAERRLAGTWKVDITIAAVPDTVLCTVDFFVLEDALWQALTEEPHGQNLLCRIAATLPPASLLKAGRQVLESRTDRGEDAATTAKLLAGWERFMQHATASDRLFCAGGE
jgi:Protein of unknown function (DUF2914)